MNSADSVIGQFCLKINLNIYSLEAVKKTAYKFAGRAAIRIEQDGGNSVQVVFSFPESLQTSSPDKVIADFSTELLDQDLREIVKKETVLVRNLILAHAFSRTNLAEKGQ